ncbi:MAG: MBL fold metallo-hydrolase [Phycisphaeraceae bacterium]|nr:MBL fold metallo-hydrolase [Phycisphaeraceae bacterium]
MPNRQHNLAPDPAEPLPTIRGIALGMFETNCYVVTVPAARDCWIIDAGFDPADLIDLIQTENLNPTAVLLTHAHCDHIAGLSEVRSAFPNIPIHLHPAEHAWLTDPMKNLSAAMGVGVVAPPATATLEDGMTLELAGTHWRVLHTPGHSPGGITLVHDASNQAIVGDTLFNGSIGRFDFPGSSEDQLRRSILEKLYTLPDQTRVYPGHGPSTTIGRERRSNPYVRG